MCEDDFARLARLWLEKAREDLRCAEHDVAGQFYTQTCFGCQQVTEKALKAFLFSRHIDLIRTHMFPDCYAGV